MGDRVAKDELFDGFARVAKALSNGRRAEIIDVLAQGERHVEDLASEIHQSIANTSFHLRRARHGRSRRYPTRGHPDLLPARIGAGRRAVELAPRCRGDTHRRDRRPRHRLSRQPRRIRRDQPRRASHGASAMATLSSSTSVPHRSYAAGHIAGARSIPIGELKRQLRTLPDDVEVVAYCRGPYCVFADEAVRLLHRRGRAARRLKDGFPEWRHADLPIATEAEQPEA